MEADAAVEMCTHIFNQFGGSVKIGRFISDDDASTRKWLNPEENSDLPKGFKRPIFLADLNHRIKVLSKPIFALASLGKRTSTCSKGDALRLKRNFAWYFKSCVGDPKVTFKEFQRNVNAPIYHHFNNHLWCNAKWC